MMERSLATFPLAPGLLSRLSQAGFFTVEDLDGIKAQDLTLGKQSAFFSFSFEITVS